MTSKKTFRALLCSVLSLVLCCSMLIGTTFAWFTDTVTSENNIIKSGTLNVGLYHGDRKDAITTDASQGTIFNYKYWEPGYTQIKYVKIVNEGDLAFKYQLTILPDVAVDTTKANLADVIDVYMLPVDADVSRAAIAAATPVGTLAELMADADGAAYGILLPTEGSTNVELKEEDKEIAKTGEISYAIVLKMQEEAGNEYQGLSVGGDGFDVRLHAIQYTWEKDSFDEQYDANAGKNSEPERNEISNLDELRQAAREGGEYYLVSDITIGAGEPVVAVAKDFVLHLNGYDIDASAQTGRPFELSDGVDFTINGTKSTDTTSNTENQEVVMVGTYGLINIPAGHNVSITLNGGKYVGATDNGSFIKPRGNGKISITLKDVVSVDDSTNGACIIDTTHYTGNQFELEIDGGYYKGNRGLNVPCGTVKNATIVATGTASSQYSAVVAQYPSKAENDGVLIEKCKIEATYGVAVGNGSKAYVKNTEISAPDEGYALLVLGTGGTIEAESITYTGQIGTTGKVTSEALIYIDGVKKYEKAPQ